MVSLRSSDSIPLTLRAPSALERFLAYVLCGFIRLATGVQTVGHSVDPKRLPCVFYANHSSHGDFLLIWSSLPADIRARTRPVAAAEYWTRGRLRRYLAAKVFNSVLIDRTPQAHQTSPIDVMLSVLNEGQSLILFPEGTRNSRDELLPFKSGIFRLAEKTPSLVFVPVWIENINRVLPKGGLLPVPLLCSLHFGPAQTYTPDEDRQSFLARLRESLQALAPTNH